MTDVVEIIKIGIVMAAGSFIQSSSGFGFGLFAIPLLLFLGFNLPAAVIIVIFGSAVQKIVAITVLWKAAAWRELSPYMITGLAGLPLGVYAMYNISFLDPEAVQMVIGFFVCILLLLQWKGVIKSTERIHSSWGYLAGFFSGFFNGLANIGGPPLVLWILVQRWSNEKMRVTPMIFSLVFLPIQVIFMFLVFDSPLLVKPLLKAALSTPFIFLGTWIGLKTGEKIASENLRIYMGLLLLVIALISITGTFFN